MRRFLLPALAGLSLLGGCNLLRNYYALGANPRNPFPEIRRVGILPFANESRAEIDTLKLSETFASECASFPGFEVTWPGTLAQVLETNRWKIESPQDAVKVAKELRLDGVFFATVSEYDPYDPPTLSLTLYLFSAAPPQGGRPGRQIWELSDMAAPGPMPGAKGSDLVAALVQRVYNGRTVAVEKRLKAWARQRSQEEDLGWEHFRRVSSEYQRFCCNMLLRDLCGLGERVERRRRAEARKSDTRR